MRTTIDQRVVEMQFDNKHFESNVSTTMSTLDKLKQSLRLDGASKGFEDVGNAAKKVDMNGLGTAVETVQAKFSALQVMGVTALSNITNSAVNAGKRLVAAFTIDPVKTGFNEYELKMDSVKTIMASTGESVETVNKYLEELNEYSDQTIYSFSDMTQNIGKFTNAGVKLEDAVMAIKGISNEAAVSGANANEASRAMYNFAQALSAGYVKLIDWKSIENANMATVEFKNQLLESAVAAGTLTRSADGMYNTLNGKTISATKDFNDSLKDEWMTTEVLVNTLKDYADNTTEIGEKAFAAAQDVTKFTQMMDVLKETAQSGWAKTWEIIFGDINKAKALFTPLTNFFSGIIDGISDFRNNLLEGALGSPFGQLAEKILTVTNATADAVDKMKDLDDVVNRVIRGDFGNQGDEGDRQYRAKKLEEAGYNYAVVQTLVNEKLGINLKLTDDLAVSEADLAKQRAKNVEELLKLTDAQLKELGFTDAEIAALRELEKQSKETGKPINELIENMDKLDGRTMLIETLKNAGSGLVGIFTALKNAWVEIFPPMTSMQLYNIIEGLYKFSENLRLTDKETGELTDTAKNLQRTLKGVFAIIDIIATFIGGAFKIAFKAITSLLGMFDLNILDVTASIGDTIVAFRDWIDATLDFTKIFENLTPTFKEAIDGIKNWFAELKDSDNIGRDIGKGIAKGLKGAIKLVGKVLLELGKYVWDGLNSFLSGIGIDTSGFTSSIGNVVNGIKEFIDSLKESDNIPRDIIAGLVNGLREGLPKVVSAAIELAKGLFTGFCDELRIESPSKEFEKAGGHITDGLINGLKDGASGVWEFIKTIGSKCVEIFKELDFGKIMGAILGVGLLVVIHKIVDSLGAFAGVGTMLEGLGDMFEDIGRGFKKLASGAQFWMIAQGIQTIAISIAILAASVAVLSFLDQGKMRSAVLAIAALAAVIAGLTFVVGKFGPKQAADLGKYTLSIMGIAGSLLLVAIALKTLAGISGDGATNAAIFLGGILVFYGLLLTFVDGCKKDIDKVGWTLAKVAIAIGLLAIVGKLIAGMKPDEMIRAATGLMGLGLIMYGLVYVLSQCGPQADVAGVAMVKMASAMLILTIVGKLIAGMKPDEMIRAATGLMGLGLIMYGLVNVLSKLNGADLTKVGSTLLLMSLAIGLLGMTAMLLGHVDIKNLAIGIVAVGLLGVIVAGLVFALNKYTPVDLAKVGTTLLLVSVSIGILAMVTTLLGLLSIEHLAKGIIAVGMLGTLISNMLRSLIGVGDCKATLIGLTAVIAVLAVATIALSFIPVDRLESAVAGLMIVMISFKQLIKSANGLQSSIGALIVLTVAIAAIGGIIYLLASLPVESCLGAAVSLSVLLVAMSASLVILKTVGKSTKDALLGVVGLLAMCIPLLALFGILKLMSGIDNVAQNALALAGLVTVLTALMIPLTIIGLLYMATAGIAATGIAGLLLMCVSLWALVEILRAMQDVQNAEANINLLTGMLTTMTDLLIKLAIVAPLALIGVAAMAGLTALMVAIGALVVGVGALMQKFPQLESFIDTGMPLLEKLANGIGSIIGNFISGFATAVMSGLPEIGKMLGKFMKYATPFINGAKLIDEKVITGVRVLSEAILALTAAELISGVTSFLSGGSSFAQLGRDLSRFMINAIPFIIGASMIKPTAMEGVKTLADVILTLTGAKILEGLTSWFTGGTSLADFGAELAAFGPYMAQYAQAVAGIDAVAVEASANAAKALSDVAANLPNSGGVVGWFMGENDMDTFGTQLVSFGKAMKEYGIAVTGLAVEAITASVSAAKALSEMSAALPNSGGVVGWFMGENDMDTFGSQLTAFGKSLKEYGDSVTGLAVDAISASVPAAKSLSEMAEALPNSGGVVSWFTGNNDMATFGTQLVTFGKSLKDYGTAVTDLPIEAIADSVTATKSLAEMNECIPDMGGIVSWFTGDKGLDKFGEKLVNFGESMGEYSATISEISISELDSATTVFKKLADMATGLQGVDFDGLSSFGKSLGEIGKDGVTDFMDAFNNASEDVSKTGGEMLSNLIKGANKKENTLLNAFKKLLDKSVKAIKDTYDDFKSAGSYVVTGFAEGITANTFEAEAAAVAMAEAALEAAKEALNEHSPSREFYDVGDYAGLGFVNALYDYVSTAYKAGTEMAGSARDGLSNAIAKVKDFISTDVDSQPTIRPVLDLSDVQSGANTINGMFGFTPSVGLLTNVGTINSMMNGRSQNGVNGDIVSAIDKLRKDLSNVEHTTYQINGITYDDGSNISNAVETLVRAARIERRA